MPVSLHHLTSARYALGLGNDESLPWREPGLDSNCVAGHFVASTSGVFLKLWWLFRGKSSLWSEYLHGRYCRNLHPTIVPYNRNHSPVWHRLYRIRDVAEPFLFWTLGEGFVSFWHNNWLGEKPLAQLLHRDTYTMEPVSYYWHGGDWNVPRILRTIPMPFAQTICQIPIAGGHGDKIVWTGSSTGDFSTKSAWEAIRQASLRRQLLADNSSGLADATKGFSFSSKCQCCEAEETVSNLFIESAAVQGVWQHFAAIFGLCLCDTWTLTHMVHFWRYSTPFYSDLHIRTLIPFLIVWFTWTLRNAVKYRGIPFSTDGIILEVQRHLRTLYAARTLTSTRWKGDLHRATVMGFIFRQTVPRAPSIVPWRAPSLSWFKLNTDDSFLGNPGLAGAAGIIRDSAGHVHLAYQLAELTAVWWGMELALTHGLAPLVVEMDITTVISLLKSRASRKWEVQHLIMRIVRLQQLLVADVKHVFREVNGATDHLAKEAASSQLTRVLHHDDITGVLRGILCLDRQGVPHLH
ncbi:UNVERIFIED_CONTAM: hypothetical protein Sradi_7205300 [Sesamum radiatum]|uniref:RNase H type-1 domain-containing protein n=1 Tax=Sesamum radiatum TaxID=300843 RepID=A0AAW2IP98_SESRA